MRTLCVTFSKRSEALPPTRWVGDAGSSMVADALAEDYDIAVRAGAHCAPRMHEALGTVEQGAVRFSFGYYNTEEETDAAIAAVRELAEQ